MNKKAIANTAILYWCNEDECYLKESPLFDSVLGVGDTPQEAEKTFSDLLDDAYESYLEGRVPGYSKPGRPAKGGLPLNSDVRPETKNRLRELAKQFDCSTGEVVDYLLFSREHLDGIMKVYTHKSASKSKLDDLSDRVTKLENFLQEKTKGKIPAQKRAKSGTKRSLAI